MIKRIIAAILALALAAVSFVGCSETETVEEKTGVIKVGNTEYTLDEFNYMYVNMFNGVYNNLYSYYGSYMGNVLDLSKPLSEQDMGDGTSWHDYINNATLDNVKTMTALYETAVAEGFELPESDAAVLDTLRENYESLAAKYNVGVDQFIEDMFGKGVTYDIVREMTEINLIAAAYANEKEQVLTVTEEEMLARYEKDKNSFDTVTFRFGSAFYSDIENYTEEDKAEYRARAEAFAAAKTEEEFKAVAIQYAPEERKADYEDESMTLYSGASYKDVGIDELAAWLFAEERTYGDTYIYEDEANGGYVAAFFVKREGIDYDLMNARHILVKPKADENGAISEAAWAEAEKKANDILAEFLSGEATEELFGELAKANSEDGGSAANGGLYTNICKGQMVPEFENWCFDESRKPGDTGIVKTKFGYHIMYFSSVGDNHLETTMKTVVLDEKFSDWVNSLVEKIEVEKYDGFEKVGEVLADVVAAAEKYSESQAESASSASEPASVPESASESASEQESSSGSESVSEPESSSESETE